MIGRLGQPGPVPAEPATTYPLLLGLGALDAAGYSVIARWCPPSPPPPGPAPP
jgi:hypothetical protein